MLTLLIDADDTLWENNIFYEACLDDFVTLMAEQGFDRDEAEQTADRVERERIPQVGYAVEGFARTGDHSAMMWRRPRWISDGGLPSTPSSYWRAWRRRWGG